MHRSIVLSLVAGGLVLCPALLRAQSQQGRAIKTVEDLTEVVRELKDVDLCDDTSERVEFFNVISKYHDFYNEALETFVKNPTVVDEDKKTNIQGGAMALTATGAVWAAIEFSKANVHDQLLSLFQSVLNHHSGEEVSFLEGQVVKLKDAAFPARGQTDIISRSVKLSFDSGRFYRLYVNVYVNREWPGFYSNISTHGDLSKVLLTIEENGGAMTTTNMRFNGLSQAVTAMMEKETQRNISRISMLDFVKRFNLSNRPEVFKAIGQFFRNLTAKETVELSFQNRLWIKRGGAIAVVLGGVGLLAGATYLASEKGNQEVEEALAAMNQACKSHKPGCAARALGSLKGGPATCETLQVLFDGVKAAVDL